MNCFHQYKIIPHTKQPPWSILIWKSIQRTLSGGIQIIWVATEDQIDSATTLKTDTVS